MRSVVLDLHNHSACSYDASSRFAHYKHAFHCGRFDVVAITDHNTTKAKRDFLNDEFRVIIGQEVDTSDGELLCLFLDSAAARDVPLGRSAVDTAKEIRHRGGLVYLQHPFYRWLRKPHRIRADAIDALLDAELIDIVEVANGGALMGTANRRAEELALKWDLPRGAGSDAHHPSDIGRCTVRIPLSKDPFEMTEGDLLAGLREGVIDRTRVRPSAVTLGVRAGYALRVGYGRLAGGERKRREPPFEEPEELPEPT